MAFSSANDYSRMGAVTIDESHDYSAIMAYFQDTNNWFKRFRGEWEMSNLVEHAKRELALIGEEQEVIDGYLKIVRAFADMNHSGGSASVAIPVINELLQFKNLTPLTNDPDEWTDVAEISGATMWQNKRNSAAFSYDQGLTYWLVTDGSNMDHQEQMYYSERTHPA